MHDHRRLDQILQSRGKVSQRQIQKALDQQSILGGKLGEHLFRQGGVGESELVEALSEQFGLPGICLQEHAVDPVLFERLPLAVAEEYLCLPVAHDPVNDTLKVAFADPADGPALEAVSAAVRPSQVLPLVAEVSQIHTALGTCRQVSAKRKGSKESGDEDFAQDLSRIDRVLDLLELALAWREGTPGSVTEDAVWVSRLAVDVAVRLDQSPPIRDTIRLAALATGVVACKQHLSTSSSSHDTLTNAAVVLRHTNFPIAAAMLEQCADSKEPVNPKDIPAAILRVAWRIAVTRPPDEDAADIGYWEARLLRTHGKILDPSIVGLAFSILRGRHLRQHLGRQLPEIVLLGTGSLTTDLRGLLQQAQCRVAVARSWKEGMTLIERRCPDLLCVMTSTVRVPPNLVFEGQIAERGLDIGCVVIVADADGAAVSALLPSPDAADVLDQSLGATVIAEHIRKVLTSRHSSHKSHLDDPKRTGQPEPVVAGKLGDLGLADLVQLLSIGRKTVRVVFSHPKGQAVLCFERGQIVFAEAGELTGDDAFFELLRWTQGRFEVHPTERIISRNVNIRTTALLLEGFHRIDESRQAERTAAVG